MNRFGRDFHGGRVGWSREGRGVSRDYDREYGDRYGAYHGRRSGYSSYQERGHYPGNRGYDAMEGYRFGNREDRGGFRRMNSEEYRDGVPERIARAAREGRIGYGGYRGAARPRGGAATTLATEGDTIEAGSPTRPGSTRFRWRSRFCFPAHHALLEADDMGERNLQDSINIGG